MTTVVRLLQLAKAEAPIEVTPSGIVVVLQPVIKALVLVTMIALQLLRESYFVFSSATTIDVRPEQRTNAPSPIFATFLGMVMEVRL